MHVFVQICTILFVTSYFSHLYRRKDRVLLLKIFSYVATDISLAFRTRQILFVNFNQNFSADELKEDKMDGSYEKWRL